MATLVQLTFTNMSVKDEGSYKCSCCIQ